MHLRFSPKIRLLLLADIIFGGIEIPAAYENSPGRRRGVPCQGCYAETQQFIREHQTEPWIEDNVFHVTDTLKDSLDITYRFRDNRLDKGKSYRFH